MATEQEYTVTIHWPEIGLPLDAEEEEQLSQWMESRKLRGLLWFSRITFTLIEVMILAIASLAVTVALYATVPALFASPGVTTWILVGAALSIVAVDIIAQYLFWSPISRAAGEASYVVMKGVASLYYLSRNPDGYRSDVSMERFARWVQLPPMYLRQRYRDDSGRNHF